MHWPKHSVKSSLQNLQHRFWFKTQDLIWAGVLKIKQVLLDSCSSKRIQVEGKHKALDQSSQARTDPDASIQFKFHSLRYHSNHNETEVDSALPFHMSCLDVQNPTWSETRIENNSCPDTHEMFSRRRAFSVGPCPWLTRRCGGGLWTLH